MTKRCTQDNIFFVNRTDTSVCFLYLPLFNKPSQGQCDCKDNVQGLACTECKKGSYNLQRSNPLGCENCNCNTYGVIGGLVICDVRGQCPCKLHVTGIQCTRCKTGYFDLAAPNLYGCSGKNVMQSMSNQNLK